MFRFVDGEPALILQTEAEKILIVSDIHIGYEKSLEKKGIKIPSLTPRLSERLEHISTKQQPDRILLTGDIKHSIGKILPHEWQDIPEFFEKLLTLGPTVEVVPGNHDGSLKNLLPREVKLHSSRGVIMGEHMKALITHGHTWPAPIGFSVNLIIMGHNHFSVEFRESSGIRAVEPVWVVARWDPEKMAREYLISKGVRHHGDPRSVFWERFNIEVGDPQIIIVPAFNPMLGGMKINRVSIERYISPILQHSGVDLKRAEVYLLDHTYLGQSENLILSEVD
jgi:putative SbcD/Mre11-related phosphoesterase